MMHLKSWTTFKISRGNQQISAEGCSATETKLGRGRIVYISGFWTDIRFQRELLAVLTRPGDLPR